MNKKDFKSHLETNLVEYQHYINQIREYLKKKNDVDTDLETQVSEYWESEVNTYYATVRAHMLKDGVDLSEWQQFLSTKDILAEIDAGLSESDFYYVEQNEKMYTKLDERGHRVTTFEGYTGYIAEEVKDYFYEEYLKQEWDVVPGHWPSMESKQDVDNWIDQMSTLIADLMKRRKEKIVER